MTLKDLKVYAKNTRGVEYSYKTIWRIMRRGVKYGKPYIMNGRRLRM